MSNVIQQTALPQRFEGPNGESIPVILNDPGDRWAVQTPDGVIVCDDESPIRVLGIIPAGSC